MINIAWYSRDGHINILPLVAEALRKEGVESTDYFVCHNEVEAQHVRTTYKARNVTSLAAYIRSRADTGDAPQKRLRELEKKYRSLPIIRTAWADIFEKGIREPELSLNVVRHFDFWEQYLTQNHIDLLVIELPSIHSTCVAWMVCQGLRLQHLSPINLAVFKDRMVFTNSWEGHYEGFSGLLDGTLNRLSLEARKWAATYLEKMRTQPEKTDVAQRKIAAKEYSHLPSSDMVHKLPGFLGRERLKRQYYVHTGGFSWLKRWARAYPNLLLHKVINVFDRVEQQNPVPFFIFPLHELGEWSNYTWMGLGYSDFNSLIREVSACLPLGYELYVKEHTSGFGLRPLSFYRAIKKHRSVRVVSPYEDTFDLLRRSSGVVTLGSSMGWEAWLMNKPVMLLGDPWYRNCPAIHRPHSPEELAEQMQCAGDLRVATEDEKLNAVAALYEVSFEGVKFPHPDALSSENVSRWARALKAKAFPAAAPAD